MIFEYVESGAVMEIQEKATVEHFSEEKARCLFRDMLSGIDVRIWKETPLCLYTNLPIPPQAVRTVTVHVLEIWLQYPYFVLLVTVSSVLPPVRDCPPRY